MGRGLSSTPIDGRAALHVCLDMQRLFAPGGPWPTPWAPTILPAVVALAERAPERTVFSRFIPPANPDAAVGRWRAYFMKWREITREEMDPRLLDLVPELLQFVPPARVVDKGGYSIFGAPEFKAVLQASPTTTLVFSGAETDVCVLASLFDAIDLGFRTVLARDAVCSSSDTGHDAVLTMLETRLPVQVEVASVDDIRAHWT